MELKKQIQNFRSEALLSRYSNAIKLGNKLLEKLRLFSTLFHQDFSQLEQQLKNQINFCIQINKFVSVEPLKDNSRLISKKTQFKSNNENTKSSWKKKNKINFYSKGKEKQNSQNQDTHQKQAMEQNETIEEKLHKNLILPLNMPLFKLKNSIYLIKTKNCLDDVRSYLLHYDFIQLQSWEVSDLGVQNILNAKNQMIELGQNRGITVVKMDINRNEKQRENDIFKLNKVLQGYRSLNKENQNQKKTIIVFLVEEQQKQLIKTQDRLDSDQELADFKEISFV